MNNIENILKGLNEEQKRAVTETIDKNSLVVAGAGSGKTKVLITRIAYLIEKGYSADSIMAITFTNRAAKELLERLKKTVEEDKCNDIWVGTYHGICIRLLSMFGSHIGFENFSILTQSDARKAAVDVLKYLGLPFDREIVTECLSKVSKLKRDVISTLSYKRQIFRESEKANHKIELHEDYAFMVFYSTFQAHNFKKKQMDFDDIIYYTILLLQKSNEALMYVKRKFKFILTDEVQDSNFANIMLIKTLSFNCNLFLVGDEDQSIYAFRGARPECMNNFIRKDKFKLLKLERNYRSTQNIVNASNALISNNEGRIDKTCYSKNVVGCKISKMRFADNLEEADFISNAIEEYIKLGVKEDDIMILYRTNSQSRIFEQEFLNKGIKYSIVGSLGFADRAEVKDILSILKLVINKKDYDSARRALQMFVGIGVAETISNDMKNCDIDFFKALSRYQVKNAKTRKNLNLLKDFINIADSKPKVIVRQIGEYYIDKIKKSKSNYEDVVHDGKVVTSLNESSINKIANISELINIASQKRKSEYTLSQFVNEITILNSKGSNDEKGVKLMTIHSAKGLESKIVFVVGLCDGILPHRNSFHKSGIDEERRLLYVAMTRAEVKLYLSSYIEYLNKPIKDSRFLCEIPSEYILE